MKTLKHLASFTLALSTLTFDASAQPDKPQPQGGALSPGRIPGQIIEVRAENREDHDGPFGFANGFVSDMEHNMKRFIAGPGDPIDSPLIISTGALDETAISNLEEDLTIMARILEKSADRAPNSENPQERKAMGIHLWALGQGAGRGARNIYIDGQGAIFLLNVNMPLRGGQPKPPAENKKDAPNSTWESARNEIYGEAGDDNEPRKNRKERIGPAFDADRLETLKKNLVDSLKNAANIRDLKDNETITIVVQGPGGPGSAGGRAVTTAGSGAWQRNAPGANKDVFVFSGPDQRQGASRTLLTLRAKKSDIDAFSKGKIDIEEFRKKVTSSTYQSGRETRSPETRSRN